MKIGDIFKFKRSGDHDYTELIILNDTKTNQRFLWSITNEIRFGCIAILYAKYIRTATKKEIKQHIKNSKKQFCI